MRSASLPRPARRLQAAHVLGATVLSIIGVRIVVDANPSSFLGDPDQLVALGSLYCILAGLTALLAVFGMLRGSRWALPAERVVLSLNISMGVPMIAVDVLIAGVLVLWNLLLLGDSLFAVSGHPRRARRSRERDVGELWQQRYGAAAQHALLVSLLGSLAVLGYPIRDAFVPGALALAFALATTVMTAPFVLQLLRRHRRYGVALALLLLFWLPGALTSLTVALVLLWILHASVLVVLLAGGPVFADLLRSFYERPALLILSTFGLLAFAGALMLTFPAASAAGSSLQFIDALFTAMSATCVTGLVVLDTPVAFSSFGHLVILVLIQLGGLGIMVLSTFAAVLLGGRLALRGEQALEEVLDLASPGSAYELTRFIVLSTLAIEALGAAALALSFYYEYSMAPLDAVWRGSFHAISAFCNAGFSLWSDSLIQFQSDPWVLSVHAGLIILGGLGFPVLAALWWRARGNERRLPLQARLVLMMSLGLLVAGAVLYAIAEWDASLAALSVQDKLLNASFQSVSLRTAGFNSVDYAPLERSTILMMIVFMFIGASPGSTGGGIKTTTLAVVLAAIPALARNQARALLLRRTIPHDIVYRAATIMTIATLVAVIVSFALLASHDMAFEKAAFETVSALATVGLSIGGTAELNALGKWLIIVTMFIGRVGPISLALALGTPRSAHVTFPETKLMVG
ncbi:TrkH family potassium uptake protein [Nannocystis sp. ILAH1]|uniref:TrkH family potassium uptake protein n=1 Tax=Nannocystis sp. ILAH1 TaxID=2996789 RepID=UPI00226F9F62|nr:TrkH family potassium uptake protein [Nannocystis sp. ILAH1]MCY0987982.1 TrkH family potassium uptake protein [Nannocystis sp. ILAH1]